MREIENERQKEIKKERRRRRRKIEEMRQKEILKHRDIMTDGWRDTFGQRGKRLRKRGER